MSRSKLIKRVLQYIPWIIAIALFFTPFFWLKPGFMDLGGDSGRWYFYDPISYITHICLYYLVPEGLGPAQPNTYYIPYVGLLAALRAIFRSSTIVIDIFSGLKLSVGFLAVNYFVLQIIRDVVRRKNDIVAELSGVASGIVYVLAPTMTGNYDKAITSHNQVFLNPLMAYLLLRFLSGRDTRYLFYALGVSLLFAPNFALTSAPPFFAFYPLSVFFLFTYVTYVLKKQLPWKWIGIGSLLFIGLHAFHLLPQLLNLFEPGSFANTRVFDRASIMQEGVRYVTAILPLSSLIQHLYLMPGPDFPVLGGVLFPFFIVWGYMVVTSQRAKRFFPKRFSALLRLFVLLGSILLVTLYLYTAKITHLGVWVYTHLFYLPGFSMFRNFIGQWPSVYTFYFSVTVGLSIYVIVRTTRFQKIIWSLVALAVFAVSIGAAPLLRGEMVNKAFPQSRNIQMTFDMDPRYEQTVEYIKALPTGGKILSLPLTDSYYQVLAGKTKGAYVGTSTLSPLTGKSDFTGYQVLGPFAEKMMKAVREKRLEDVVDILSKLSIRYIFYNSDPGIYEQGFPESPYTYMKTAFPDTQQGYQELVTHLPVKQVYTNGLYHIYELVESVRRPIIYISNLQGRPVHDRAELSVQLVNPVTYQMKVSHANGEEKMLVLHNLYNSQWKLWIDGKRVPENEHILYDEYANAWRLPVDELSGKTSYTMRLKLVSQRYIQWGFAVTALSVIGLGAVFIYRNKHGWYV